MGFPKNDGSYVPQRPTAQEGKRRASGYGKTNRNWDPAPGTVAWYKANMAERFNNTMLNIRSAGYTQQQAESFAAQVLRWNEKPLASMRFDNKKCVGCGMGFEHTDKPFPKWDRTQPEIKDASQSKM